jgi:hypothetical protein
MHPRDVFIFKVVCYRNVQINLSWQKWCLRSDLILIMRQYSVPSVPPITIGSTFHTWPQGGCVVTDRRTLEEK